MFVGDEVPLGGGDRHGPARRPTRTCRAHSDAAITSMKEDGTPNELLDPSGFGEETQTYE